MTMVSRSPVGGWNRAPRIIRPSRNIAATEAASRAPRAGRLSRKWPPPGISQAKATAGAHLLTGGAAPVPDFSATTLFYRIMILMQISRGLAAELTRAEVWIPWVQRGARVAMILGGAWLLTKIARRLTVQLRAYVIHIVARRGDGPETEIEKRASTIVAILRKLASSVI